MTNKECTLIQPLLGAYLDGEIEEDAAATLSEHLERCESCRALLSRVAEADRAIRAVDVEWPSEFEWARLERSLMARARVRRFRRAARTAAVAAAAAVVLAALFWLASVLDQRGGGVSPLRPEVTAQGQNPQAPPEEAPLDISVERG